MRTEADDIAEWVLLIDADAEVRSLAKRFLESSGYRVLAAGSPAEAMHLLGEHGPVELLLVTDTVMPGVSGQQVAEMIEEKNPGVQVLFLSRCLQKPFTVAALAARIREVLETHASLPASA